jgi:hypothetical protein
VLRCRLITARREQPEDVLDHDQPGAEDGDRADRLMPHPGPVAVQHPGPPPGRGDVLTRASDREHVNRLRRRPVDRSEVPEVFHRGEPVGEDPRHVGIVVGYPGELPAEDRLNGQIDAPVT